MLASYGCLSPTFLTLSVSPISGVQSEVAPCGHGQPLFRSGAAQAHVRAVVIVTPHPAGGELVKTNKGTQYLILAWARVVTARLN